MPSWSSQYNLLFYQNLIIMNAYNLVELIGRLTSDADTKLFENGNGVIGFIVAVDDSYKDNSGEWVNETYFIKCKLFVKSKKVLDALSTLFQKGNQFSIRGKLKSRYWDNADGERSYEIYVDIMEQQLIAEPERS